MLAFTENAVAYATQLEHTEGNNCVANFHSTGVQVDAGAGYVNWLNDEGCKLGFMLHQGMHSLGLLPSFFKVFSDKQAQSCWLYKPQHIPEDPTDKQEPMDVEVPPTQEEDNEDDVQVGLRYCAQCAYKCPVPFNFSSDIVCLEILDGNVTRFQTWKVQMVGNLRLNTTLSSLTRRRR